MTEPEHWIALAAVAVVFVVGCSLLWSCGGTGSAAEYSEPPGNGEALCQFFLRHVPTKRASRSAHPPPPAMTRVFADNLHL